MSQAHGVQDDCRDAGDTIPGKDSVESSLETRSLPLGYRDREQHRDDHMDVGDRILPGHSHGCEW